MFPVARFPFYRTLFWVPVLSTALLTARAQPSAPTDAKLSLNAALVLTSDLCVPLAKVRYGGMTYDISAQEMEVRVRHAACAALEGGLREVLANVTRVDAESSLGDAQVALVPRIANVNKTRPANGFKKTELVVILEWKAKDKLGKTVWIETVQSSGKRMCLDNAKPRVKHGKTYLGCWDLLAEEVVNDAVAQSASKMSSSPELRKLAQ
jgi:hypothetical protein